MGGAGDSTTAAAMAEAAVAMVEAKKLSGVVMGASKLSDLTRRQRMPSAKLELKELLALIAKVTAAKLHADTEADERGLPRLGFDEVLWQWLCTREPGRGAALHDRFESRSAR